VGGRGVGVGGMGNERGVKRVEGLVEKTKGGED